MAVNQTNVALNSCSKISNLVSSLLNSLDELESIGEQLRKANINLSAYDSDIAAGEGICQATGTTYQIIANEVGAEIVRALKNYDSVLTPSIKAWAALQRARQ